MLQQYSPYTYGDTLLSCENLNLFLSQDGEKKHILRDVNVTVKDIIRPGITTGQRIAFLGPSGIGKSQFLGCVTGLTKPTSGGVFLTKDRIPTRAGLVGMVSQKYTLFRHRDVYGNLMLAATQNGNSKDAADAKQKVEDMIEKFELQPFRHHYPVQLSGGQQQRVAIAQQLLCSEHFLTMDEPFAALDPKNVKKVCKLIEQVANENELNTVIVVTHDVKSAIICADTIWLMGRERDAQGNKIPGARIFETINLIDRGLCWRPDIESLPEFFETEKEILAKFDIL